MKDNEIAQLVNNLAHTAKLYGQTHQIRERIRQEIEPILKGLELKKSPLSRNEIFMAMGKVHIRQQITDDFIVEVARAVEKALGIE